MPGWSSARSEDARVSVTSSPARRSAASSSGRESGLRPGASNASRTSAASASSRCGRAPRGGRGPSRSVSSRSWTSTRHGTPAYVISAATSAPDDSAASSSPSRRPRRRRHRSQLPGVLEVGAQVLGRVVDREQRRVGRRARPEPVPVLRLLPRQQLRVHRGRPPQQVVAQPQVVAALDPHPGRQQRRVPPRRVVPHPARRVASRALHVRRQVGQRHLVLRVTVDHQHPVARQARERDPGHGDTLTPRGDTPSVRGGGWVRTGGHPPPTRGSPMSSTTFTVHTSLSPSEMMTLMTDFGPNRVRPGRTSTRRTSRCTSRPGLGRGHRGHRDGVGARALLVGRGGRDDHDRDPRLEPMGMAADGGTGSRPTAGVPTWR